MHPWQFHTAPPAAEGPAPEEPRVMDECHLDCQGRQRHFRLQEHHQPFRSFLSATELLDGKPIGMRLLQPFNDELEMPPHYELRRRIAERLATRDLVKDPETGELRDLHMRIRALIHGVGDDPGEGPELLIDGDVVPWADLGHLLSTYENWGLRLEITDTGEE